MKAYTDYPFVELGDRAGEQAPVREVEILAYDGNKYCDILVEGQLLSVKSGYLYTQPGRHLDVPTVKGKELDKLQVPREERMKEQYWMFIDDERHPPKHWEQYRHQVCRNLSEVKQCISLFGWPSLVSFDHDLGQCEPTGYDIAKWMVEQDLNTKCWPDGILLYQVHSMNPVGARNIREYLDAYILMRDL